MRILLTGTTGQVGGALLPLLEQRGVVLAPRRDALDLSRPETLVPILDKLRPDLIVNPAAYTAVDQAEDTPELAFRVNAEAPGVFAKWAARNNVEMIHFSTDYVFDGSGTEPWREESEPRPLSVYGESKLAGDRAVMEAGCAHLIVRTSWVYATKGSNFLTAILRLARERDELRVVADQFGAPTSARVIAEAVRGVLNGCGSQPTATFGRCAGILNVACSGETSWHGFAKAIVEEARVRKIDLKVSEVIPIRSEEFPTKTKRPKNSRLDLGKLSRCAKIKPIQWGDEMKHELDQMISTSSTARLQPPI